MFPLDTQTFFYELIGPGTQAVTNNGGPNTILGASIQQGNVSSDSEVLCGTVTVAKNYATNFSHVPMNYQCDDDIYVTKTGNDAASFVVNYVEYLTNDPTNYPTTTLEYLQDYNPPIGINGTTSINVYGSFSAGEVLISFLLLCLILLALARSLAQALSNIKTKKKYLQYGGGDVEIRDDL